MAMNHEGGNHPRTTALLTAVGPSPTAAAMFFRPRASASSEAVIMPDSYPQFVDAGKTTFGGLRFKPQNVNLNSMSKADAQYAEIGERLTRVRQAFSELNQSLWAAKHGFAKTQYNNWESGTRRIPVDEAERLCEIYGLTLDWVYRGRRDGLSESASKVL